jgi:ATP-dependent Clp protease ATP-binding subunit ClpX
METSSRPNVYCSFCNKDYREVGPLVVGGHVDTVRICYSCAELVIQIIDEERERRAAARKDSESKPDSPPA